jgi:predicted peptidase
MQQPQELILRDDFTLRYLIYLPPNLDSSPRWPLILFLHGSGERGDDLERVRRAGLPFNIERGYRPPFVVVSPQCPVNERWTDHADNLLSLLDHILKTQPVDPDRVILSGLSMGGQGAWYLASEHPDRFAAIAPICGRIPPIKGYPEKVCALQNIPVWVFHGARDSIVPVENSQILAHTLRACGGKVQLTLYPNLDHHSWDAAYANPDLYTWMLAQKRKT